MKLAAFDLISSADEISRVKTIFPVGFAAFALNELALAVHIIRMAGPRIGPMSLKSGLL